MRIVSTAVLLLLVACSSDPGPGADSDGRVDESYSIDEDVPSDEVAALAGSGHPEAGSGAEPVAGTVGEAGETSPDDAGSFEPEAGTGGGNAGTSEPEAGTGGTDGMAGSGGSAGSGEAGSDAMAGTGGTGVEEPECNFNTDCDDGNPCTEDTCVNHECTVNAEANDGVTCTDTAISDPVLSQAATCRAGVCCGGCMDSVLGCMRDDTMYNEASCGFGGNACNVCQPDAPFPNCVSGKCCPTIVPC